MNRNRVYPLLVPRSYVEDRRDTVEGLALPIGHDVYVVLVEDHAGATRPLALEECRREGIDLAVAHNLAKLNLQERWKEREMTAQLLRTPHGRPFLVWHSHWLAASCLFLADLLRLCERHLQTREVLLAIPHPSTLLAFPRGDAEDRAEMRRLIDENEGDAVSRLTAEWFVLTPDGVVEFRESN